MMKIFLTTILISLQMVIYSPISFAEKLVIIHPKPKSALDTRYNYHWEILEKALRTTKNEGSYEIKEAEIVMVEKRVLKELKNGTGKINLIRDTAGIEIERLLLPIRIPLLKGTLGNRIFLIKKQRHADISKIKSLKDLKTFSIGQGQGWGDVELLRANGFKVITGTKYEGLFAMLMKGRFDLFSRGINEAPKELAARAHKYPDMTIEQKFILRYPYYEYFFVNKKDTVMAERIERGLNNIIANGTMDQIFDKYFGKLFASLKFSERTVFEIKNPMIDIHPQLDRKELWLNHYLQKMETGDIK